MGVVDTPSLADVVALLKAEAPKLRDAGVLSLKYGEVCVAFAPAMGEMPVMQDDEPENTNTFNDPATYGLPPDAEVPGFSRPGSLTDEDMEHGRDR
jgi:hypothetical protein